MNLHAKMAVLFGVMLFSLLLLCDFLVYQSVEVVRQNDFKHQLQEIANATANVVLRSEKLSIDKLQPFREQMLQRLPDEALQIESSDGQLIYRLGENQNWPLECQRHVNRPGETWIWQDGDGSGLAYRFDDGAKSYRILIQAHDETGAKMLKNLIRNMVMIGVFGLLIALILGRLLAKKALKQVSDLIGKVEGMAENDLNQRLPVPKTKDELQRLAISFNLFFQRLQKSIQAQKQMIALASHELRTPLTVIHAELDVTLMQDRGKEEYFKALESVRLQVRRLKDLNQQLLSLARSQNILLPEQIQILRIDDLIFDILPRLHIVYPQVRFETQIDAEHIELFELEGDTELLRSLCLNLCENAFKFHFGDTPIVILIAADAQQICLRWENALENFVAEFWYNSKIPFRRQENSQGKVGSGLGLALCENVARLHQGKINYEWDQKSKRLGVSLFLPHQLQKRRPLAALE